MGSQIALLAPLQGAIIVCLHSGGIARLRGLNHRLMAVNPPGSPSGLFFRQPLRHGPCAADLLPDFQSE